MIYLDTTAVTKLVAAHPESQQLRAYLRKHTDDRWFTCALTRVELERSMPAAAGDIHTMISGLDIVTISERLLDDTSRVPPAPSVADALHVAAAQTAATHLSAFVTYDTDRATTARAAGLQIIQPGLAG